MTEHNLVAGTTYAVSIRRERGSGQRYVGRYLGVTNGGHHFELEGGVRLTCDEWSIEGVSAVDEVLA